MDIFNLPDGFIFQDKPGEWVPSEKYYNDQANYPRTGQFQRLKNKPPRYAIQPYRFATTDGLEIGVYLNGRRAHLPPVFVISNTSKGTFPAARLWEKYFQFYNPIMAETRNIGNGTAIGQTSKCSLDKSIDDWVGLIEKTGYTEISVVGLSLGGQMAFRLAEKLLNQGYKVPFVAGISPTLCDEDQRWFFNDVAFSDKSSPGLKTAFMNLQKPVVQTRKTPGKDLLDYYDTALNNPKSEDDFLENVVRVIRFEKSAYTANKDYLMESLSTKNLKNSLSGYDLNGFLEKGADLTQQEQFYKKETIVVLRQISLAKLWINAFKNNCWLGDDGVVPILKRLVSNPKTNVLCLYGNNDIWLPPSYQKTMQDIFQTADPLNKLVSVIGEGHGLEYGSMASDEIKQSMNKVQETFFDFIEDQRANYYNQKCPENSVLYKKATNAKIQKPGR